MLRLATDERASHGCLGELARSVRELRVQGVKVDARKFLAEADPLRRAFDIGQATSQCGCGGLMVEFTSATADIRGEYRYTLTRVWDASLPTVTYVLLNPSTADAPELDQTLRRCVKFATREGFGGMLILNLYAFSTKDSKVMLSAPDPVGPENDRVFAGATGTVIAGWGKNAESVRVDRVSTLLPRLHSSGVTKNGHPCHPLYVDGATPLVEWAPR